MTSLPRLLRDGFEGKSLRSTLVLYLVGLTIMGPLFVWRFWK